MRNLSKMYTNIDVINAERILCCRGNTTVYEIDGDIVMHITGEDAIVYNENDYNDYMYHFMDIPRGDCLEIGLGLGIGSRCLLTMPFVDNVTTIEKNKNVVHVHNKLIPLLDKRENKWLTYNKNIHDIVIVDNYLDYVLNTDSKFDFILFNFYDNIDNNNIHIIKDLYKVSNKILKHNGYIMCKTFQDISKDVEIEFYDLIK